MEQTNDKQKKLDTLKRMRDAAVGPERAEMRSALEYAVKLAEQDRQQEGDTQEYTMSVADDFLLRVVQGRPSREREWLDAGALKLSRMMNDETTTPEGNSSGAEWLAAQIGE